MHGSQKRLERRLARFAIRDINLRFREDEAEFREESAAARLTRAAAELQAAAHRAEVAQPAGMPKETVHLQAGAVGRRRGGLGRRHDRGRGGGPAAGAQRAREQAGEEEGARFISGLEREEMYRPRAAICSRTGSNRKTKVKLLGVLLRCHYN